MINRRQIGCLGEDLALTYLEHFGYRLAARNFRYRRGEIDLIVFKEHLLVFVEVKSRSQTLFGYPEAFVTHSQALLIKQTAEHCLERFAYYGPIRFDIIAITWGEPPTIDHFEEAF